MIDVKQAVKIAHAYIIDLYGEANLPGLMLEETELSDEHKYWMITFGFDTDRKTVPDTSFFRPTPLFIRDYKIIKIEAETGEVESMMIRQL